MTKSVTTFRENLRTMKIGESITYRPRLHSSYLVTASLLKSRGEGEWICSCGKYNRMGSVTRVK